MTNVNFNISPSYGFSDNPKFKFTNESTNAIRYEWFYNGQLVSREKDIIKMFQEPGTYCITLVAINDCEQRDSITKCCVVYQKGTILIPNAFTPNGDGKNDKFQALVSSQTLHYSLQISNRWGQEVFKSNNPNEGWDGRFNDQDQGIGVYYYLIKVIFDYPNAKEELFKGDISLIR